MRKAIGTLFALLSVAASANAAGPDFEFIRDAKGRLVGAKRVAAAPAVQAKKAKPPRKVDPITSAYNFLGSHGAAFGIKQHRKELEASRAEGDLLGMEHIRYQHVHNGFPVVGSELIVHVGQDGLVSSAGSSFALLGKVSASKPKLSRTKAIKIARKIWQTEHATYLHPKIRKAELVILTPQLLNPKLLPLELAATGADSYLVWAVHVGSKQILSDETYYVDAVSGAYRFHLNHIRRLNAVKRELWDCTAERWNPGHCVNRYINPDYPNYPFYRLEGEPARGENPIYGGTDMDDMYDLFGVLHEYVAQRFGMNGANGHGGTGNSWDVRVEVSDAITYIDEPGKTVCPDAMYAYGGLQLCQGTVTDEIVRHEYNHATWYSRYFSGLGEAGSLEESASDVLAQTFEYARTGSTDWIIWFGVPGRNLASPEKLSYTKPAFTPYPDRYYAPSVYCGGDDDGGAHWNSTVPSKAFYLMAEGGVFNGCSISPIGKERVEQIVNRAALQYLGAYVTFGAAYHDFQRSCADLYGEGSNICRQVRDALQAVEMDQLGHCADPGEAQRLAPACRPSCASLVYHPEYNPHQLTKEARIGYCLSIGFKWAGIKQDAADGSYHWEGNCRENPDGWNTPPYNNLDLTECGVTLPEPQCHDSDGGSVYALKGRVGISASGPYFDQDYCQLGGDPGNPSRAFHSASCAGADCNLIEMKCEAGRFRSQAHNCPGGCRDGACI